MPTVFRCRMGPWSPPTSVRSALVNATWSRYVRALYHPECWRWVIVTEIRGWEGIVAHVCCRLPLGPCLDPCSWTIYSPDERICQSGLGQVTGARLYAQMRQLLRLAVLTSTNIPLLGPSLARRQRASYSCRRDVVSAHPHFLHQIKVDASA